MLWLSVYSDRVRLDWPVPMERGVRIPEQPVLRRAQESGVVRESEPGRPFAEVRSMVRPVEAASVAQQELAQETERVFARSVEATVPVQMFRQGWVPSTPWPCPDPSRDRRRLR